nr:PREDICTED: RAD9, HUS1, RAD1-interacting nuclear orphan protein 1 [Latimeria chalumnae]|eukprot:XP_006002859.2 PREDICTED: RAD9, HUS1, RAD1-interacting nuclear orphan protein 1 [Latimeria chalumnae]
MVPFNHATSSTWVSPQFDDSAEIHCQRRHRRHWRSRNVSRCGGRANAATQSMLSRAVKGRPKASVCRFPTLLFKDSFASAQAENTAPTSKHFQGELGKGTPAPINVEEGRSPVELQNVHLLCVHSGNRKGSNGTSQASEVLNREKNPSGGRASISDLVDSAPDEVFTPPSVQTPDLTSPVSGFGTERSIKALQNGGSPDRCDVTLCQNGSKCLSRRGLCLSNGTPKGVSTASVLVEDTPKQEYGMKVTWRRRQHIMRYLQDQGRLTSTQIIVNQH